MRVRTDRHASATELTEAGHDRGRRVRLAGDLAQAARVHLQGGAGAPLGAALTSGVSAPTIFINTDVDRPGTLGAINGINEMVLNLALNAAALEVATRLAASTDAAPRWIGKDAVRELTSPAVKRQIAAVARPPRRRA